MYRLFIPNLKLEAPAILSAEQKNYLKKVLRYKDQQEIIVFDQSNEFLGVFFQDQILLKKLLRKNDSKNEKNIKIALAEIRKPRFEWFVEKATELGVTEIFILKTDRSQHEINDLSRLQKIAVESAEQCNRISVPVIYPRQNLKQFLENQTLNTSNGDKWHFANINSKNNLCEFGNFIIGPEGGWSNDEIQLLGKMCSEISLGENILRSETAAIFSISKFLCK